MKKIIIIVGPTGVGKTSLSIQLAKYFHTEIISGDSMQVYKEMSIGTAKIKEEETCGIKHYMIDKYSYRDEFNVMIFQKEARKIIDQLDLENKLPIICGGTGLYIKSLYYDYEFNEEEEDLEFKEFLQLRSIDECWKMLQIVDPEACHSLHPNNTKRVRRAIMRAHLGNNKSDAENKQQHQEIYDAYVIGLTAPRETIYERINSRVDQMIKEGLEEEVENLICKKSDWELQSMQGIGYKEWKGYFQGNMSFDDTVELIKKNSRNFAKRQYTWFNNQMNVHWYDITDNDYKERLMNDLDKWMNKEKEC
ncbi:MAG: tRNA (adenosine(37)-N6)-dimethylallyltransferase MiaA [Traorella sp.]